jgi:hypothetical protein
MGRHSAAEGSSVHPLVAEGLARRAGTTAGAPGRAVPAVTERTAEPEPESEGELGWPAPPHRGGGLGWPGDMPDDSEASPEEPAPSARRRGWRRLFRVAPAA